MGWGLFYGLGLKYLLKYLQNSTRMNLLSAMASSKLVVVRTRTPSSSSGFSAMTEKRKRDPIKSVDKNFIIILKEGAKTKMKWADQQRLMKYQKPLKVI